MLHQKMIQKQRRILKRSYDDRMEVWRFTKVRTELGETKLEKESVYSDVPCYMSIGTVKGSEEGEIAARSSNEYLVFADCDICLQDSDEVCIRKGTATYRGRSSKTYVYDTHGETSVRIEGVV